MMIFLFIKYYATGSFDLRQIRLVSCNDGLSFRDVYFPYAAMVEEHEMDSLLIL